MNKNINQFAQRKVKVNNQWMMNYSYESDNKLYDIYQEETGEYKFLINYSLSDKMPMHNEIIKHFNLK